MTKTLQLNLQKRIIIVELPVGTIRTEIMNNVENTQTILLHLYDEKGCFQSLAISEPGILRGICDGSELDEETLTPFLEFFVFDQVIDNHTYSGNVYKDYRDNGYLDSALDSFISAIEAKGWFWEKHNIPIPYSTSKGFDEWDENGKIYEDVFKYYEAESRTLHPEQCLIFEEIV